MSDQVPSETPANRVSVEPLAGSGWCIKMNGVPERSMISKQAPVVTKSDKTGVTYSHEGQTYHLPWPA